MAHPSARGGGDVNVWRRTKLVLALGLAGLLVAVATLSVLADEPSSRFHAAPADAASSLLEEAQAQRLEVLRLLSGPQALRAEPAGPPPGRTLYVVISPPREYASTEVEALTDFVVQGGQLLVADNFGQANSLAAAFGITFERVRLVGTTLDVSIDGRTMSVQADAPTALHFGPDTSPAILAWSTADSFLDRDGDGLVQAWEPRGPFPVVAAASVGSSGGRVVAVADPGLLHGSTDDGPANEAFRRALLAHLLPDGGRLVIDESRTASTDPVLLAAATFVGAATGDPWRYGLAGLAVALFVIGVLVTIHGHWGPHRFLLDRFIRRADIHSPAPRDADEPPASGTQRRPGVHWTRRGMAAVFAGVLLVVLGTALGNLHATYAGAFLLLAAAFALWTRGPSMEARRTTTIAQVHEESRTEMRFTLDSVGRGTQEVEVLDWLPPEFELADGHNWFRVTLRPKAGLSHSYVFRAALRGPYPVGPLRLRSTDAFALRTVESQACEAQRILVLPRNDPLSRIPFKSRIPVLTMGPHLVNRAGDGTEFHALRDYQAGDSIRIVNWKASARSKDLVVNQRVHESKATLTVFLDARAISQAGPLRTNPVNEGCRAVQSIVTGGLQARDNVRVIVYGDGVEELCPRAGPGKGYKLSQALANVEPAGAMPFAQAVQEILPTLRPGSPVILVSGMEADDSVTDGIRLLGQRSIPSTVIALDIGTEPESPDAEPEPDAQMLQAEREKTIAKIRGADVPVVRARPGTPLGLMFQVGLQ